MPDDLNPKAARAATDGKAPLDYLESAACDPGEARVLKHGADKYGRRNFRDTPINVTTYVAALRRHVNAWASGEDIDPDSGEHHLAHIRANCAVALASADAGTMVDDRGVQETKQHLACGTSDCCGTCGTTPDPEPSVIDATCCLGGPVDDLCYAAGQQMPGGHCTGMVAR